jgi:polysaccharide deacetylase family protein (PEP-CTERM system associated)
MTASAGRPEAQEVRARQEDVHAPVRVAATTAAPLVNAMTVDVEDWFQVAAFFDHVDRASWDARELRVERNTERLLALFAERGITATFFVLGWVAERLPSLAPRIAAAGHEIACHGWSHALVYRQTPVQFRDETFRAKKLLEDQVGAPVRGYRASTYSITRDTQWALDVLLDAGFEYDSSIFPVRHPQYGVPGAARFPGRIETPYRRQIVEFPLSTVKIGPASLPVSGGGYFRFLPYALTRSGLARINRVERQPFIFYLHPWELDPGQPRVAGAKATSRIRHYTNLDRCEARLIRLLGDFGFGTVASVLTQAGLLADRPTNVLPLPRVLGAAG